LDLTKRLMEKVSRIEDLFSYSKNPKFFKDVDNIFERLTWEEVIDNIDRNVSEDVFPEIKVRSNLGLVCHDTRDLVKTHAVRSSIMKNRPNIHPTAHLYVSLTSVSETFGKHDDFMDVIVWQNLGVTRWFLFADETHVIDLKPGEFIYIPMGMFHDTIPITPRASMSFGLENRPAGDLNL